MIAHCTLTGATRAAFVVPTGQLEECRSCVFRAARGPAIRVEVLEVATGTVDMSGWHEDARALADRVRSL